MLFKSLGSEQLIFQLWPFDPVFPLSFAVMFVSSNNPFNSFPPFSIESVVSKASTPMLASTSWTLLNLHIHRHTKFCFVHKYFPVLSMKRLTSESHALDSLSRSSNSISPVEELFVRMKGLKGNSQSRCSKTASTLQCGVLDRTNTARKDITLFCEWDISLFLSSYILCCPLGLINVKN